MAKDVPTSTKRFGVRYGRRTKLMFGRIEEETKADHKCPYCSYMMAKRLSMGIWKCDKCGSKFTGKAYTL